MGIEHDGQVYLSVQEASEYARRHRQTILNSYKTYGWRTMYFGRGIYFLKSDISEWLQDPKAFQLKQTSEAPR